MAVRMYRAIPQTTEIEEETSISRTTEMEPETEPESKTDTETDMETGTEPSIYVNIRDFGLSMRIRSFVRVIFSVCMPVYFLDEWRLLYLPTRTFDGL